RQSQLIAQGSVAIKAVDGLKIDLKHIDQKSVGQTIEAMVQADPNLAWLKEAEQRGDVDWRRVKEIHDSWSYSNSGLGVGAQLAIAIVMAAYVGPAALKAMGGGAVAAGGAAVATGAASNASISFINNRGDLGAVWQDTTSSDALKGYAISGITAGLTQGYFNDWTGTTSDLTGKITVDLGSLKGIGQFAASQGLQNGTALALGRIMGQGGDLGDALQSTLLNTLAAVSFNAVGDYTKGVYADGSIQKVMIHAMVGGLLAEASGGDFKAGALAAGANEALVDQLDTWVGGDKFLLDMTSQLVGLLAASTLDDADAQSLQTGAWVAQNATQYNHELHQKNAESFAEGALDFCKKQPAYCGPGADQVSEQDMMDALAATAAHGEGIDKVKPEALRLVNQFLANPDLADTLQNDLFAPTVSEQQRLDTLEKAELAAAGVSAAALAKAVLAGGGQLLSKLVGALKGQSQKGGLSVKHVSGVELPKSQSQMIANFEAAGYPSKSVVSPTSGKVVGTQYTLPDGSRVRVMQADGRSPQRASFENANGGPIDPTTGKPPQPPKGLSNAERKQWIRERTHIEQVN
ncbi:DUF637 domain-containing protein, partial [Pseudomonas delhiensis]|uniref:DUF637 domain-containing protein n=1 Tax=Pseudomonas delhiensis TaxID=366289 RepID=UPI00315AABCF